MSTAPAIKQVDPSQPVTVARPERVRALLDSVRSAARDASTKATFGRGRGQQRLGPRDLLHGTLLRVDRDGKGALDERGLKRALRDLRAALPEDGCRQLVCWYGVDGTGSLPRRAGVFSRDSGASARPTGGNSPRGRSGGKVAATPRGASRTFRGQGRRDAAGDRGRIVGRDRPKFASADVRGAGPLDRSSFAIGTRSLLTTRFQKTAGATSRRPSPRRCPRSRRRSRPSPRRRPRGARSPKSPPKRPRLKSGCGSSRPSRSRARRRARFSGAALTGLLLPPRRACRAEPQGSAVA